MKDDVQINGKENISYKEFLKGVPDNLHYEYDYLKGLDDGEVVGMLETPAHPAGVVVFGEILRAGQAEEMPAIRQHWAEEQLQADGALQSLRLQQLPDSMLSQSPPLRPPAFPRQPALQELPQLPPRNRALRQLLLGLRLPLLASSHRNYYRAQLSSKN